MRSTLWRCALIWLFIHLAVLLGFAQQTALAQGRPDYHWMRSGQSWLAGPQSAGRTDLSWFVDGSLLAISNRHWVDLYDTSTGMLRDQLSDISWNDPITKFLPDGELVVYWTLNNPGQVQIFSQEVGERVNCRAWADSDTLIVVHGAHPGNNFVKAYRISDGATLWQNDFGFYNGVGSVVVSAGGCGAADGGGIRFFDPTTGNASGYSSVDAFMIAFSPDGATLAYASWTNNALGFLDVATGATRGTTASGRIGSMDWSSDGM